MDVSPQYIRDYNVRHLLHRYCLVGNKTFVTAETSKYSQIKLSRCLLVVEFVFFYVNLFDFSLFILEFMLLIFLYPKFLFSRKSHLTPLAMFKI